MEQKVFISGGGSGLGLAVAQHLAKKGCHIAIIGRRKNVLDEAVKKITAENSEISCQSYVCDLRDHQAITATVEKAYAEGEITGLINNAAANFLCPGELLSPNGFKAIWSIVAEGTFFLTQALGRKWIADGVKGSVCSISTTYASGAGTYMVPSAMAKAAVEAMTRTLSVEWADYHIRCNAVAPGLFPTTGSFSRLAPNMSEQSVQECLLNYIPMKRYGEYKELAELIDFLLHADVSYLTGQTIDIDGGLKLAGTAGPFYHEFKNFKQEDWRKFRGLVTERLKD